MEASTPAWLTVAVAVVTLLGGALLGFYAKWRRTSIQLASEQTKVTVEGQRAVTDLNIHVRDDVIDAWKQKAEDEKKRADEADARANRLIEFANKRTDEANHRADAAGEECDKRMEGIVTRYREREAAQTKQHQERELQFQSIVDKLREDHDEKIAAVAAKHEDCLRQNAEMTGRIFQVEKQLAEVQARLDARDMRRRNDGQTR